MIPKGWVASLDDRFEFFCVAYSKGIANASYRVTFLEPTAPEAFEVFVSDVTFFLRRDREWLGHQSSFSYCASCKDRIETALIDNVKNQHSITMGFKRRVRTQAML